MAAIVEIQLQHLRGRLAERRIDLVVTDAALDRLARDGYDAAFGARPLKRMIQKEVGDRLALAILENKVADGDTATLDVDDAGFVLV
jgi:ATP-dependent Clp protease ATP-binding subunit ClpB